MFAILGISLLGGRMGYCDIENYYNISRDVCISTGNQWLTWKTNFDNILNAMNTLYIVSTLEGWPDYMF